jgi:hypothetical protein
MKLLFIFMLVIFLSCGNKSQNDDNNPVIHGEVPEENTNDIANDFNENRMTHYVSDNLRLRDGDNLSSRVIATLPQYMALRIIETGRTDEIDGITAPWIKIVSQTGSTGWCFSGYVSQIEDNVIEGLAAAFANRKSLTYPKRRDVFLNRENVSSIDLIREETGYYIQQEARRYQGPGRTPEILTLSVENENVYIREIDIVNNELITRNEIQLQFNGRTFVHNIEVQVYNSTRLLVQDGRIQIIYLEHYDRIESGRYGVWEYQDPYTFAGSLNTPMSDRIIRLTTDYLTTFSGEYIFDSYKIVSQENWAIDTDFMMSATFNIDYNHEKKCLTIPTNNYNLYFYRRAFGRSSPSERWRFNFVETMAEEPFFWSVGEGMGGFFEQRFYFYKGGIAFTIESSNRDYDDELETTVESNIKYVVFFKKKI